MNKITNQDNCKIGKINNKDSYKKAGVDIDKANELVGNIKEIAKDTNIEGSFQNNIGSFGALFDISNHLNNIKQPILVSSTDGVGTKVKLSIMANYYDNIGVDLVAMCVNDIIVQGAKPLFFLDYLAISSLDKDKITKILSSIARGCKLASTCLIGGETAEMPDIYKDNDYDIAGFTVGIADKNNLLPKINNIKKGDIIIGIKSNGIHSNGFSMVRYILKNKNIDPFKVKLSDQRYLIETLLDETKIYVDICNKLINLSNIKAFSHITGGGILENIKRVIPEGLSPSINFDNFEMDEIFHFLKNNSDIENEEFARIFNCSIGMAVIIDEKDYDNISSILTKEQEIFYNIGQII